MISADSVLCFEFQRYNLIQIQPAACNLYIIEDPPHPSEHGVHG